VDDRSVIFDSTHAKADAGACAWIAVDAKMYPYGPSKKLLGEGGGSAGGSRFIIDERRSIVRELRTGIGDLTNCGRLQRHF